MRVDWKSPISARFQSAAWKAKPLKASSYWVVLLWIISPGREEKKSSTTQMCPSFHLAAANSERHTGALCVQVAQLPCVTRHKHRLACTQTHSSGQKQVNQRWVESRIISCIKKSLLKILYSEKNKTKTKQQQQRIEKIWILALLWKLRPWDFRSFAPLGLSIGE